MDRTTNYNVWFSRCTAVLSVLGSLAIIYIILSARRSKLTKPKNRFMLMMSVFDVLSSLAIVVSTAALPRDTGIYGAIGNEATCTAQSIFLGLGLSVPLYNSSLNLFYLLTIRYSMTATRFSAKFEPFLHAFSVLGPLLSTTTFAALGYAKPSTTACLFPEKVIIRAGFAAVVVITFLFCLYSMGTICWSVINQANRIRRHRYGTTETNRGTILEKEETIKQALLYSLAFLLTFTFPTIQAAVLIGNPESNFLPALDTLTSIFYPLQGFYNFVFYVRPGVNHVREMDPSKSIYGAIQEVVLNAEDVSNSFRNRRARTPRQRTNDINTYVETVRNSLNKKAMNSGGADTEEVANDVENACRKHDRPTVTLSSISCGLKPIQEVHHKFSCPLENSVDLEMIYTQPQNTTRTALEHNDAVSDTMLSPTIDTLSLACLEDYKGSNLRSKPRIQTSICNMSEHYNNDKDNEHDITNIISSRDGRRRASLASLASVLSGLSLDSVDNDMSNEQRLPISICNMNEPYNEEKEDGSIIANIPLPRAGTRRASLASLASVLSDASLESLDTWQ